MMERNTMDEIIREKLLNAEVQAPGFDTLLGNGDLEECVLRSVLSEKLLHQHATTPDFDSLFGAELLGVVPVAIPSSTSVRKRWNHWLTITSVAAACIAVAFLLPNMLNDKISVQQPLASHQSIQQKAEKAILKSTERPSSVASKSLKTPTSFAQVTPSSTSVHSVQRESANADEAVSTVFEASSTETSTEITLKRIEPATKRNIQTTNAYVALERAYANAIKQKSKSQKDRLAIGANLNGSSRMLSMVNRGHTGTTMNSVVNKTGAGYEGFASAQMPSLRSAVVDENAWSDVENLTANQLQNYETNFQLPINIGLTAAIPLFENVSLITGIQYSYIANRISGSTFSLRQELHYLGIPAKLSLNIIKRSRFTGYLITGGTLEKGLIGIQKSEVDGQDPWEGSQAIKGFAASLTGGLGASYDLGPNMLLCLEPGVSWYIPTNQPICYRTERPFNFSLSFGLRYRFQ